MGAIMTADNATIPTRSTRRAAVDFHEYVIDYSARQRVNLFALATGMALATGSIMYLSGALLVAFTSIGLGLGIAGAGALLIAIDAHACYTRYLAITETATYPEAQPAQAARPFMPSRNGAANIRAGRFSLTADTWAALFAGAARNGGRVTRDGAARVLPRPLYRDWQSTIEELQRLGMVDVDGMATEAGYEFANVTPPRPVAVNPAEGAHSTHARRTNGAHGGES